MQQALERAGIKANHGWNYAMDAIEMANLMRQIKQSAATTVDSTAVLSGSASPALTGERVKQHSETL
jgi:6,7-dimethyl-8-ribityllumazine synthase